ncbi:MAG: methionyl-tRNA formyltransferase [Bacteroidia bacterium]|nr:methionyl-tRNA formyltransferase [Bacteroidia bacterium]
MRLVFMGTSDFAVPALELLHRFHEVVCVVTAVSKPAGRGLQITASPVKKKATQLNIPVLQPEKLRSEEFINQLIDFHADLFVVVAFRMLPESVWKIPHRGTINLHASLLPDYRGAAPINWALINGETQTGVTTFKIQQEIDTGNILLQRAVEIQPEWNLEDLYQKLQTIGSELLLETINNLEKNELTEIPQPVLPNLHSAPKITKENTQINPDSEAIKVHNLIRGLSPAPCAWMWLPNQKQLKVFFSSLTNQPVEPTQIGSFRKHQGQFQLACKDFWLNLESVQSEGKKRMSGQEFARGFHVNPQIK